MDDLRAKRPTGILTDLRRRLRHWIATDPEPPTSWSVPRGLGLLPGLLEQVTTANSRPYGPVNPPAKLASGYDYRSVALGAWAHAAGLDVDVAALAWCLASEAPSIRRVPQYAWAIAEAAVNASRPNLVAFRICGDSRFHSAHAVDPMALFMGKQGGRWCSTWQQPTGQHVECATLVLTRARSGEANIVARGATQWTDNETQHLIHAAAVRSGDTRKAMHNPTPEDVMLRRYHSGQRWIGPVVDALGVVVIDPWILALLGPSGVSLDAAMTMLADGRRRWSRPEKAR